MMSTLWRKSLDASADTLDSLIATWSPHTRLPRYALLLSRSWSSSQRRTKNEQSWCWWNNGLNLRRSGLWTHRAPPSETIGTAHHLHRALPSSSSWFWSVAWGTPTARIGAAASSPIAQPTTSAVIHALGWVPLMWRVEHSGATTATWASTSASRQRRGRSRGRRTSSPAWRRCVHKHGVEVHGPPALVRVGHDHLRFQHDARVPNCAQQRLWLWMVACRDTDETSGCLSFRMDACCRRGEKKQLMICKEGKEKPMLKRMKGTLKSVTS
jgi:hypothetical protein